MTTKTKRYVGVGKGAGRGPGGGGRGGPGGVWVGGWWWRGQVRTHQVHNIKSDEATGAERGQTRFCKLLHYTSVRVQHLHHTAQGTRVQHPQTSRHGSGIVIFLQASGFDLHHSGSGWPTVDCTVMSPKPGSQHMLANETGPSHNNNNYNDGRRRVRPL